MNNQPIKKKEKKMVKKTVKKAEKKAKSSKVTLKSLQNANPVMVTGELVKKAISYLINNEGTAFTSYELHSIIGGNSSKAVRDGFRSLGLKKANIPTNQGVIEYEKEYALVMGKQGSRVTYKAVKLG